MVLLQSPHTQTVGLQLYNLLSACSYHTNTASNNQGNENEERSPGNGEEDEKLSTTDGFVRTFSMMARAVLSIRSGAIGDNHLVPGFTAFRAHREAKACPHWKSPKMIKNQFSIGSQGWDMFQTYWLTETRHQDAERCSASEHDHRRTTVTINLVYISKSWLFSWGRFVSPEFEIVEVLAVPPKTHSWGVTNVQGFACTR